MTKLGRKFPLPLLSLWAVDALSLPTGLECGARRLSGEKKDCKFSDQCDRDYITHIYRTAIVAYFFVAHLSEPGPFSQDVEMMIYLHVSSLSNAEENVDI